MPEGPEVAITASGMGSLMEKKRVRIDNHDPMDVRSVISHGKVIVIDAGTSIWRLTLGMTGSVRLRDLGSPVPKHTTSTFAIMGAYEDPIQHLDVVDPRKFGKLLKVTSHQEAIKNIGHDWRSVDRITAGSSLFKAGSRRKKPARSVLTDQSIIAGVGNAYCNEAFHRVKMMPDVPANKLDLDQWTALWDAAEASMRLGYELGGLSLKDFISPLGVLGTAQNVVLVYGRVGQACKSCATGTIQRAEIDGRSTFYCDACQAGSVLAAA